MLNNPLIAVFILLGVSFSSAVLCAQIDLNTTTAVDINDDPLITHCETDRDCPETEYCYGSRKSVCVRCLDCTTKNRHNRIRCARVIQDCGDCLPGFTSDAYFSQRRWCKMILATAESQRMEDTVDWISLKWIAVGSVIGFTILGFASYFWYNRRSHRTRTPNTPNNEPSVIYIADTTNATASMPPPPSYRETVDSDDGDVSCSFQLHIVEHAVADQKAIPYFGNDIRGMNHGGNNVQHVVAQQSNNNSATVDNVAPVMPSEATDATTVHNDIHDENTTPSFWTPGENYGVDVEAETRAENQTAPTKTSGSQPTKRKSTEEPENFKKKRGG